MAKISKTEERIEYRTKRNGEKEKVIIKTPYEGDKVSYNLNITLDMDYPDFRTGEEYDRSAAKDFLLDTLIEYLQNNREQIKEKLSISDAYINPYNFLDASLRMSSSD